MMSETEVDNNSDLEDVLDHLHASAWKNSRFDLIQDPQGNWHNHQHRPLGRADTRQSFPVAEVLELIKCQECLEVKIFRAAPVWRTSTEEQRDYVQVHFKHDEMENKEVGAARLLKIHEDLKMLQVAIIGRANSVPLALLKHQLFKTLLQEEREIVKELQSDTNLQDEMRELMITQSQAARLPKVGEHLLLKPSGSQKVSSFSLLNLLWPEDRELGELNGRIPVKVIMHFLAREIYEANGFEFFAIKEKDSAAVLETAHVLFKDDVKAGIADHLGGAFWGSAPKDAIMESALIRARALEGEND